MPVHLFGRPAARLQRLRPAGDRGRRAGVRRRRDRDERRLDLQLLPDQESVRARRRRAHLRQRRRARRAPAHAALPRVGGEEGVRSTSATTRASTRCRRRSCASSCGTSTSWNAQRREAAARYAELLDGLVETPDDEDGHVYHMYCVRSPERDRLAAALTGRRHRLRRLLPAAAASAAGAALPRLLGGRLPGDGEGGAREPLPAALGRDHGGAAGRGRLRAQARLRARALVKCASRSTGTGSGSSSSTRS